MVPSVADSVLHDNADPRPLKRPRKSGGAARVRESEEHRFVDSAPMDHIFITEGNVAKKSGGKKAPLSCCECRRLKLKCDRSFPCSSCKKRGCAEICPDGVLVSGKGTRFILANTEQLHTKIHEMSERIRQLEDALEKLQSQCSSEPHPLLGPELLTVKSTMGLYGGAQVSAEASASSPSENGHEYDSKSSKMDVDTPERGPTEETLKGPTVQSTKPRCASSDRLASEVVRLSHSYPLPDNVSPEPNLPLRQYIRSMLPDRSEAEYLWEQARENALWQYNPHPSSTFFPNLLHHCYTSPIEELSPRRLSLLMMILAMGCLVDLNKRGPDSPDGEHYHQLARASLCEIPPMEETNVETITALFYEIWYLLVFSDKKKAAGYAWGLMGLTAKLAHSIGLHRNGGNSKVIPEEVEKRRSLFWELLYLDARLSLSLGRPPSLCIRYMDCPRPSYNPDPDVDVSESLHYYQEWKHSCYIECLAPVLHASSQPSLEYNVVLDLDKKIRDFSFPQPLSHNGALQSRLLVMQKASLSTALEAVLLQLHRTWFTRALSGPEEAFNRRHKYAPSVVAVFLSASRMIATVQDLFNREPRLAARILGYWSNAFSAAVALCLLVSRAPFTCLSPAALQELQRARVLFNAAKDTCPRALQVIHILEAMVDKANDIYNRWANGQEVPTVLQHVVGEDAHEPDTTAVLVSSVTQSGGGAEYVQQQQNQPQHSFLTPVTTQPQTTADSFVHTHRSLSQCIVEVHQRARALFPQRKPCKCSGTTPVPCPPSHFWSPPPSMPPQASPVLPDLYSTATFQHGVLPSDGPALPSLLSPTSKMAVVDTINFELGALNSTTEPSWMSFF